MSSLKTLTHNTMFYPHYKSIKNRLDDQVKILKDVQWFNEQYSSAIHGEMVAFIEFPDRVNVRGISKETNRSEFAFTIHVVSRTLADNDSSISDAQVKDHDDLSILVRDALDTYQLSYNGSPLGSKLQLTGYQVAHQYKGKLVTRLYFSTKMTLA